MIVVQPHQGRIHSMNNFNSRYAKNWSETSVRTRKATRFRCVLCLQRAHVAHHAAYRKTNGKPISGNERAGVHVFPLCNSCHEIAHRSKNWIWDKENPRLGNRNSPEFYKKLRAGWKKLRGIK